MGVAVGTLAALIGSQMTVLIGAGNAGWLLPVAIALLLSFFRRIRKVSLAPVTLGDRYQWISVLITGSLGLLAAVPGMLRTPIADGYVLGSRYHGDLVFFESVAQFISQTGPSDSSLLAGFGIRYHWFSYAWIGSVTETSGVEPFVIMTRLFPVVMVIGVALLSVAWASLLSTRAWTPLLAGLLIVVGGFLGAEQGVILNYDSPSTTYAALLALAFGLGLSVLSHRNYASFGASWPVLSILGFLAAGMMGAKVSQAVVVLAGLTTVAFASLWLFPHLRRRFWTALGVSALGILVTYQVVISGVAPSSTNIAISLTGEKVSTFQGLDPFPGALGGILGTLAIVLAIVPRWLGTVWLGRNRGRPWNPEAAFGVGVAVAGILPVVVLSSGTNAAWFAVAASPLLGVLSAVGLERAWRHIAESLPRFLILSAIAAVGVNAALLVAHGLGVVSGAPVLWRGPVLAWAVALFLALGIAAVNRGASTIALRWLVAATTILVFASIGARFNGSVAWSVAREPLTPAFEQAIRWTDPTAEFARDAGSTPQSSPFEAGVGALTDAPETGLAGSQAGLVQWTPRLNEAALWLAPQVAEGELIAVDATYLQPFLPVVTDLTMYVAGEPYISGYTTMAGVQAADLRESRVRNFLENPSTDAAAALWADGVRWLWLQMTPQSTIEPLQQWASTALASDQVTILRLNDPDANFE